MSASIDRLPNSLFSLTRDKLDKLLAS